MVAVALVGYIVTGEVRKFQHRAKRDQFVAELRGIAAIFETYRAQKGEWPAATHAESRIPRGMESALAQTAWSAGSPLGGHYEWMPPPRAVPKVKKAEIAPEDREAQPETEEKEVVKKPAAGGLIAVTAFSPDAPLELTEEDLRYIDGKLDDGNLATGKFRAGFNRWPVYHVNPAQ